MNRMDRKVFPVFHKGCFGDCPVCGNELVGHFWVSSAIDDVDRVIGCDACAHGIDVDDNQREICPNCGSLVDEFVVVSGGEIIGCECCASQYDRDDAAHDWFEEEGLKC